MTALTFNCLAFLDTVLWSIKGLWADQLTMWLTVAAIVIVLVGVGGALWPYFWNKKWQLWKATTSQLLVCGALIVLIVTSMFTLVQTNPFVSKPSEIQEFKSTATLTTLNGDPYCKLREIMYGSMTDKEKRIYFCGGKTTGSVDSRYRLNIPEKAKTPNGETVDGKKIFTPKAIKKMNQTLASWKKAYNVSLYTALGGVIIFFVYVWFCAYSDIKERIYKAKNAVGGDTASDADADADASSDEDDEDE